MIVCIYRDDAAEFDDGAVDLAGHVDNREVVVWRKSNKVSHNLKSFWILKRERLIILKIITPEWTIQED